ncbi:MAG: tyrosine-type recombinase/integrase [Oscillospiraceae bacterium]|nr:tyrosine-type recombinase/integrase [Oscillospiraceae bacterium]
MLEVNSAFIDKHRDILSFRDLAPGTVATYASYLKTYIEWVEEHLPDRPLSSVSWEEIRSFIRWLKDVRELNPRTVNVHIAQLRDFFYYVLHRDWDKREVPFLHFDQFLPAVPTREQVKAIIDSITNPKHKAEIALLYSSGIRVSELCRLHCGDIIRSKNCIYISRSKNRSDRYAVLSNKAYDLLVSYIHSSYRGAKSEDWLFPGQKPGAHTCEQTVYNVFVHQLGNTGLSGCGFNLHSLRHAFGLHLYEAGADLFSIKEAMGHKSLSSTEVYLALGIGNGRSVKSPYDFD